MLCPPWHHVHDDLMCAPCTYPYPCQDPLRMRVTSPSSRGLLVAEQGYLRGPRGGCLLQMTCLCPLHSPTPPPWRWGRQELALHAVIAPHPMAGKPTLPNSGRSLPSGQRCTDAASPSTSRSLMDRILRSLAVPPWQQPHGDRVHLRP